MPSTVFSFQRMIVYEPATSGVNDKATEASDAVVALVEVIVALATLEFVPAVRTIVGAAAVDPAGAETTAAAITVVSAARFVAAIETVDVAVYATPVRPEGLVVVIAPTVTSPGRTTAAFDGTTESVPKPREATATSATRLKVVFVDICFLSISRVREFPALGFG
jgi:hypothetical protein